MTLKRRNFLGMAGAGAATALAAPAIAQTTPTVTWRLQSSYPKSLPTLFGACEYFAKAVNEGSDGKFHIQTFSAGEIIPALQVTDACGAGTVEMGQTAGSFAIGKDPAFGLATGIPWTLNARQQAAWLYHEGGLDLLNELYAALGVYALPAGNTGAQMGGWFRKPIISVSDLSGLKMRIAGLGGFVLAKLGVVSQQFGAGDIYPALESGTLDAAEFVGPADDEKLGLAKVAPYYHYPSPWEGSGEIAFVFNKAKWDELPQTYKTLLTTAATAAAHDMLAKYDSLNPHALRRLVASGAILTQFPQDVIVASRAAALDLYKELSERSPNFKKIYEHQRAFQEVSQQWVGISELRYDYDITAAFMNKQK